MSTETILSATLHVVDVKSGTLKNKRNVPMKSFCDDENIELHMTCFPGYIAIAILSELFVFPISNSAESSTLDIVKRCHQTNESSSKPPVTFPNLHSFLSKTEQHRDAERRWAQRLATCPDEAQFTALYSEGRLAMNQGKLHEYLDSEARNKRLRKKRRSKATADKMDEESDALILDPVVAQYVLTQTALRLKEDESFWPRSSLLDMISVSDVSPSLYTVIVKAAVRCKDEDVLKAVLRRDDVDLEEVAIVECLKLALNNDNCKRDELLSLILKKPFNDYTMRSALRNLSFKAALDLLKSFLEVLKPEETEPSLSFLSELEATTWIGLVLDAHFAQLMLDPKARDVIVRLHGSVTEKVHVYHQLRRIEGILDYLAKPPKESQQKSNRLRYSIESMEV
ncbi:nucleolar protein 11-like [Oscarella lobularis]|uniref:nucleolar protein 11-like n=1 Tax=Oscarella lobularis TaxID=121494 RepID=UPI003313346A